MAGRSGGNEYEAMAEFAKQLWERYLIRRVKADLLNHSLDGYKATVETNNGDGTLTVRRPYDDTAMTLRCPPALAEEAQPGKQVLVIQLGDASNAFILCGTDLSGFGGGGGGGESVDLLGDIAQLTADSLSTSNRIRKYFLQDTSDDAFLRIRGENIEYVVGTVTSQTPVQAQDRYGRPLYWEAQPAGHLPDGSPVDIAGDRIYSTFIVTNWPVYTYTYTDDVQATYVRSTRTVNGYPLSSDVTLDASDVGALASNGTAVNAKRLVAVHNISGNVGWYHFLDITSGVSNSRQVTILVSNGYTSAVGLLQVYFTRTSGGVSTARVGWLSTAIPPDNVRWQISSDTLSLYAYKSTDNNGALTFTVLSAINRVGTNLAEDLLVWDDTAITEPTTANNAVATTYNDLDRLLWFPAQAVSAGTAQQILSITDARITADYVLAGITFSDPEYITGRGSWVSAAGSFTLTGTATAATTADILLVRKGN